MSRSFKAKGNFLKKRTLRSTRRKAKTVDRYFSRYAYVVNLNMLLRIKGDDQISRYHVYVNCEGRHNIVSFAGFTRLCFELTTTTLERTALVIYPICTVHLCVIPWRGLKQTHNECTLVGIFRVYCSAFHLEEEKCREISQRSCMFLRFREEHHCKLVYV